ncbi:hypothetical protein RRG08_037195 [Elysia crispata]|uniref:Uncharacterized protein n=1 Tax=Elysia crispata TaxID=231223 RepID=A0AAE0Z398_9GAST|nr:hypothetical protein RRG08_037195 [Elysia crispata]
MSGGVRVRGDLDVDETCIFMGFPLHSVPELVCLYGCGSPLDDANHCLVCHMRILSHVCPQQSSWTC